MHGDPSDTGLASRRQTREACFVAALLLLIGACYFRGLALVGGRLATAEPAGYYGGLTEALLDGQLHLKIAPDPRLLRLQNPYAGPQGTERPHDMSFYGGRFYLYYGITPVLILFGPWRLLTGAYLTEAAAVTTFSFGGVLLWTLWLWRIKRRLFPETATGWLLLAVAGMGWGSPFFLHCNDSSFYLVPITAAAFCLAMTVLCVLQASLGEHPARSAAWLALASLGYGLAVGARPNYVAGVPLLAGVALILWRRQPHAERWRWPALRFWPAAVVPAAVVGAGLAMYNYLRFDDPFDFGIRFSLASGDLRELRLMGPEFIGSNLGLYLLDPAAFYRYYPFIFTLGRPFGVMPHLPLAAVALVFPFTLFSRRLRGDPAWATGGLLALGAALANLMLLACFFGGEDRYLLDFASPAFALAGAISFLPSGQPGFAGRSARIGIGAIAGWTLLNGVLLGLINRPGTERRLWLERAANSVVGWWEHAARTEHGPVEMEIQLLRKPGGSKETLLATGGLRGSYDAVQAHYLDDGRVQFGFEHLGAGGPVSEPVFLAPDATHRLELHLGSLYPPATHRYFSGVPRSVVERLRFTVEIKVDDSTVLDAASDFYPSTPACVSLGRNPDGSGSFSGRIVRAGRLQLTPAARPRLAHGPVRLRLKLPAYRTGPGQPLLSTGHFGAGDLILLKFQDDGRVRLGHDSWGGGMVLSEAFTVDPAHEYTLDVDFGALQERPAGAGHTAPLRVRLDGETMLAIDRPFHPTTLDEIVASYNLTRASSADRMFTGRVTAMENIPSWPELPPESGRGPIKLAVIFNATRPGIAEPLLVTGRTGAADVVFVRYADDTHVRIGLDHWGIGHVLSEPIPIDYRATHRIEIDLASLSPRIQSRPADLVSRVMVNGEAILTAPWPAYPAEPTEIAVGRNEIGASTCETLFTGRLLAVHQKDSL